MIARYVAVAALVALLAACGSSGHDAAPPPPPQKPKPKPKPRTSGPLVVTILDGDRRVRVPRARVSLLGKIGRTDRHGVTTFDAPRRRLAVRVVAKDFTTVTERLNFGHRRKQTIRIYQPDLQWPLYGANRARTQAPTQIHLRPPFRLIWSRGLGQLIEFPAVVWNGFAYIGNQRATVQAISMRSGKLAWRHDTRGAPRMASSPQSTGIGSSTTRWAAACTSSTARTGT